MVCSGVCISQVSVVAAVVVLLLFFLAILVFRAACIVGGVPAAPVSCHLGDILLFVVFGDKKKLELLRFAGAGMCIFLNA